MHVLLAVGPGGRTACVAEQSRRSRSQERDWWGSAAGLCSVDLQPLASALIGYDVIGRPELCAVQSLLRVGLVFCCRMGHQLLEVSPDQTAPPKRWEPAQADRPSMTLSSVGLSVLVPS